jgi:Fe-S cluster assembly protein SufD
MFESQTVQTIDKQFIDWYLANQDGLMSGSNPVFNAYRSEAMDYFQTLGIPGSRNENYKYSNLKEAFNVPYHRYLKPRKIIFSLEDMFRCDIPELDTYLLTLVNGYYHDDKPGLTKLSNGILMGSMAEAAIEFPDLMKQHYAKYADHKKDGMVALNTAFAQDGTFIYVPKSCSSDKPIQIVNLLLSPEDLFVQHRNMVILEEGAHVKVVVCDHSLSLQSYLTNSVTEIYVGENASLDFTKVQNEHDDTKQVSSSFVFQEKNSHVTFNTVSLNGGLIRNNLTATLNGEGAENVTQGLFFADKTQHIDNFTFIDHAVPNCLSRQNFKGIMDENATGAFTGRILVRKDAQKTEAYQTNNNICMTDTAKMHSKPQLEIYADDVKCSHGATVGQLDESALFYLQSRGIPCREARLLLMGAFGSEILKSVKVEPLKVRLKESVSQRLRGELSRCNSCPLQCEN